MTYACRAQAPCSSELLQRYAGRDATQPFHAAAHSQAAKEMMQGFLVGYYMEPEQEVVQVHLLFQENLFEFYYIVVDSPHKAAFHL